MDLLESPDHIRPGRTDSPPPGTLPPSRTSVCEGRQTAQSPPDFLQRIRCEPADKNGRGDEARRGDSWFEPAEAGFVERREVKGGKRSEVGGGGEFIPEQNDSDVEEKVVRSQSCVKLKDGVSSSPSRLSAHLNNNFRCSQSQQMRSDFFPEVADFIPSHEDMDTSPSLVEPSTRKLSQRHLSDMGSFVPSDESVDSNNDYNYNDVFNTDPAKSFSLSLRSSSSSSLSSGPVLAAPSPGRWKRGRLLGRGAFGEVFVCYDVDKGSELAVKQVRLAHDSSMALHHNKEVRSLVIEMSILTRLSHSNIVQYYGFEESDTVLSIFVEYMPGGSVRDQLKQYGCLTEAVASCYTRQVLSGLSYLHQQYIIHRDIKGANILRTVTGQVKLADFGASKLLDQLTHQSQQLGQQKQQLGQQKQQLGQQKQQLGQQKQQLGQQKMSADSELYETREAQSIAGTPYYMSPELINGCKYGRKTDIWSLGCTVVEMLTTTPPWHHYEGVAAIFKIAQCTGEPEYCLPVECGDTVKQFLNQCFQKQPSNRPTALQLINLPFISPHHTSEVTL